VSGCIVEGVEFFPYVLVVRRPVGGLVACNVKFRNGEGAVAVDADVFGSGTAEEEHLPVAAVRNGHTEQTTADATAAALIPDDEEQDSLNEQIVDEHDGRPLQIMEKCLLSQDYDVRGRSVPDFKAAVDCVQQERGPSEFRREYAPVPHLNTQTTAAHRKLPKVWR